MKGGKGQKGRLGGSEGVGWVWKGKKGQVGFIGLDFRNLQKIRVQKKPRGRKKEDNNFLKREVIWRKIFKTRFYKKDEDCCKS